MPAHQYDADACCMHMRNYATALPAVAGLAAALLLTACSSGVSSHPAAGTTTSPARAPAASTVSVSDQKDSNWAGYLVTSSATKKTSFSAVSGGWTEPAVHCEAGFPSHSAFWVGLGGSARRSRCRPRLSSCPVPSITDPSMDVITMEE